MKLVDTPNNKIWFTSDFHLGHFNCIRNSNRPFSGVAEMETHFVSMAQEMISQGDIVFHLGDFCWHKAIAERVIPQLPGTWYWIRGNHDKDLEKYLRSVDKLNTLYDILDLTVNDQPITLCHYPMISWNKSHYDAQQLYGHHHRFSGDGYFRHGKKLNVGVDLWEYKVVSFQTIQKAMSLRTPNWDMIRRAND